MNLIGHLSSFCNLALIKLKWSHFFWLWLIKHRVNLDLWGGSNDSPQAWCQPSTCSIQLPHFHHKMKHLLQRSVIFLSLMVSFCLNSPTPFGINYSHFICNEWSHRMHSGYWGLKGHKILLLNLYLAWWKLRLHGLCKTFFLITNRRKYLPQLNAEAFWYCLSKYWPLRFLEAIPGETLLVAGKRNRETCSCQRHFCLSNLINYKPEM